MTELERAGVNAHAILDGLAKFSFGPDADVPFVERKADGSDVVHLVMSVKKMQRLLTQGSESTRYLVADALLAKEAVNLGQIATFFKALYPDLDLLKYRGPYEDGATYAKGESVLVGGKLYVSKVANNTDAPPSAAWSVEKDQSPEATTTQKGIAQYATNAEALAMVNTDRVLTANQLALFKVPLKARATVPSDFNVDDVEFEKPEHAYIISHIGTPTGVLWHVHTFWGGNNTRATQFATISDDVIPRAYTRNKRTDGTWSAWRTMNASSGSNANGWWTRIDDGTLIQHGRRTSDTNGDALITMPLWYVDTAWDIVCTPVHSTIPVVVTVVDDPDTHTYTVKTLKATDGTAIQCGFRWVAIGKGA